MRFSQGVGSDRKKSRHHILLSARKGSESPVSTTEMSLFHKLLRMLALTKERELTCMEVNELLDYYVELEQSGENVKALMPTMTQHLRICPECKEEYEALKQITGIDLAMATPEVG